MVEGIFFVFVFCFVLSFFPSIGGRLRLALWLWWNPLYRLNRNHGGLIIRDNICSSVLSSTENCFFLHVGTVFLLPELFSEVEI